MANPFVDTSAITSATVSGASTISCDFPVSGGGQGGSLPPDAAYSSYLAAFTVRGASAPTLNTPSGWTAVDTVANDNGTEFVALGLYYKSYDGSTGQATFTNNVSGKITLAIVIVTEVNLSSPAVITVSDDGTGSGTGTVVVGSVTTAYDNSLLFGIFAEAFPAGSLGTQINAPTGFTAHYQTGATSTTASLTVASATQGTAGASGTKTANAVFASSGNTLAPFNASVGILASVNPFLGPTRPTLVRPDGSEQITSGVDYTITWIASTSPTVAQGSIQYHVQVSANNGSSWTDVEALTSGGDTTSVWDTTGFSVGTLYLVRVRAWDGSQFGPYDTSSATFSIIADVTPGAPTGLHIQQPSGTPTTLIDRAATSIVAWTFNDPGDVQSERTWEWGTNGSTFPNTSTSSTAAQTISVAGATFSHGTIFHRVKTEDNAGTASAYSATQSFLAGDKPSAPNITAPTAGSPPTSATPTITITASGNTAYRYRWLQGGNQVFDSGKVNSTALSWVSDYFVANGVAYDLKVSIYNVDGLQSNEDTETVTPSFSGPSAPTLDASDIGEYIQLTITNSDTPDHNELLKDGVRIASSIAVDGIFRDYNVKHGVSYSYVARAVSAAGLFTDSSSDSDSVSLDKLWVHVLTKDSSTSNAVDGTVVGLTNLIPQQRIPAYISAQKKCVGRSAPLPVFGQVRSERLQVTCRITRAELTKLATLETAYEQNADVCVRDQKGNRIYGRISDLSKSRNYPFVDVSFEVERTAYDEEV